MATDLKQLPIRLQPSDAERLERLAQAYMLSQSEVLRTLVRWLDSESIDQAIQRSRGLNR
jgi:hypothetical protein